MMKSREDILASATAILATEPVNIPEWGGDVIVSELTAISADEFSTSMMRERPKLGGKPGELESYADTTNQRAKLVSRAIVDADGKRVFTDEDAAALGTQPSALIGKLFDVAARLSGMGPDAEAAAEGNSDAVPSDGSPSGSAPSSDSPLPDIS